VDDQHRTNNDNDVMPFGDDDALRQLVSRKLDCLLTVVDW